MDFNLSDARPMKVRVVAWDLKKPNTKLFDWTLNLSAARLIQLRFPLAPMTMGLWIYSADGNDDSSLKVSNITYKPLITRPCSLGADIDSFAKFVKNFSLRAGYLKTGIASSPDDKYHIVYEDWMRDRKTGKILNTPARIGHDSGIIGAAKGKFLNYTVPMRYIILLHEGGHKFMNPKMGAVIENEKGADLNALYIYLCQGFPPMEARKAFAQVFVGAENKLNKSRMAIIEDFITKFEQGKIKF